MDERGQGRGRQQAGRVVGRGKTEQHEGSRRNLHTCRYMYRHTCTCTHGAHTGTQTGPHRAHTWMRLHLTRHKARQQQQAAAQQLWQEGLGVDTRLYLQPPLHLGHDSQHSPEKPGKSGRCGLHEMRRLSLHLHLHLFTLHTRHHQQHTAEQGRVTHKPSH